MSVNISIIIPVYSGENYIQKLTHEIQGIRQEWIEHDYPISISELIFVDDNSIDSSSDILNKLEKESWINVLTLSKNYGQHSATAAGISYSSGDWIVTMDEDLQHDPKYILEMLKKCILCKIDLVYAEPKSWVHSSIYRDVSSKTYKKIISALTKNNNISKFNSFRVIRGSIARSASAVLSHDGYFDIVLGWFTNRISTISLEITDQRYVQDGKSGYSFEKLITHARKLIMTSDAKLLRIVAFLGLFMLILCVILISYYLGLNFFYPESISVDGWTTVILVILGVGGGTAIILSLIAEYIAIITQQIHGKPAFSVVDRTVDKLLYDFFNYKN